MAHANGGRAEHIPDTYREDLLREISLMKSIGRHRHIVSMVGACTARTPIALIMEYVPYGNLQNFLKFVSFIRFHLGLARIAALVIDCLIV